MDKRLYLTKLIKVTLPDPIGDTYVPYTGSVPLSGRQWQIMTDDVGDTNGTGVFEKCFLSIYATSEEHALLEADDQILRIDTL